MKKLVVSLMILLAVGSAAAVDFSSLENGNVDGVQSSINNQTDNAPPILSGLLGNQTVNLEIESEEGPDMKAGAKMEGLVVSDMKVNGYENATVTIKTDQETINEISESNNPAGTAISELKEGNISYEAKGFWNKLKFSVAEAFL